MGVAVAGTTGGRVMASGAGWAWLRDGDEVIHVCGPRGPRGPLTAVVDRVPILAAGDVVMLDAVGAANWRTPATPIGADPDAVRAASLAVRPHAWNDPRALQLGHAPFAEVATELLGRGPGLTPAGDDAICGYLYTRRTTAPEAAGDEATFAVAHAATATGQPSLSLIRAAASGEVFAPVAAMVVALLRADGPALAPAVRALSQLGKTTGRAALTGILAALDAQEISTRSSRASGSSAAP